MALTLRPESSIQQSDYFAQLVELTLGELESANSKRVYRQTYNAWRTWCADNDVQPLDLRPGDVKAFLADEDVTKTTRQRQLSALRQLARQIFLLMPSEQTNRYMVGLERMKVPTAEDVVGMGQERTAHALTPAQADKVLRVWTGSENRHRRNQALIAVLALGALRRSEAAVLKWSDIDFENGVVVVRHGKGDKARDVPLAGDFALDALRAWQARIPGRTFVFCPIIKGDKLTADKPISGTDVYRVVEQTEALSGVEFKPHDLRRTFITEALATGTPLKTVQAAAGHARGEQTLKYAQAVDAREARKALKLRYG